MFVFVLFDLEEVVVVKFVMCVEKFGIVIKKMICQICDIVCSVVLEVQNGWVIKVWLLDNLIFWDYICMKGIIVLKGYVNLN